MYDVMKTPRPTLALNYAHEQKHDAHMAGCVLLPCSDAGPTQTVLIMSRELTGNESTLSTETSHHLSLFLIGQSYN